MTLTNDQLSIALIVLSVIVIALIGIIVYMHGRMKRFLVDVDSQNIADSLESVSTDLKTLQIFRNELEKYLAEVERRLRKSVQSVHTVRFNPFKGAGGGGNQSFSTAFVNQEGDGVIISSLYSRDHVSMFAKPVVKNASEHELSEEERESLENALKNLK